MRREMQKNDAPARRTPFSGSAGAPEMSSRADSKSERARERVDVERESGEQEDKSKREKERERGGSMGGRRREIGRDNDDGRRLSDHSSV